MNKADLVNAMADAADISKVQAGKAIDAALATIEGALATGDKVVLAGFGSFQTSQRSARQGTHPKTGKKITIESKRVVKFKAGKQLSEVVGG